MTTEDSASSSNDRKPVMSWEEERKRVDEVADRVASEAIKRGGVSASEPQNDAEVLLHEMLRLKSQLEQNELDLRRSKGVYGTLSLGSSSNRWERNLTWQREAKGVLDFLRWIIILSVWGIVCLRLYETGHWIWLTAWVPIGFILTVNVVGFATLPIYFLLAFVWHRIFGDPIEMLIQDSSAQADDVDDENRKAKVGQENRTLAMDKMLLELFHREVERQSRFGLIAASDLEAAIECRDMDRIWYSVQSLLGAAGNVSKLLWPGKPKIPKRGEDLRESLGVPDSSPLEPRAFRNHFEHFDERLEKWATSSQRRNFADSNVGTISMIPEFDPDDYLRNFDTNEFAVTFRGDKYPLKPIIEALQDLYDNTQSPASSQ